MKVNDNPSNVILQDLRNFIVKIYLLEDESIVGTGFFVSQDGTIVTCAHVLENNGINPKEIGSEIGIYFSKAKEENKNGKAQVIAFYPEHDEDIVLLQLVNNPFHLFLENVARLGSANLSFNHTFRSFGYRQLGDYIGLPAGGTIVGYSDRPIGKRLLIDPLIVNSDEIDKGMSGAPILDERRNLVVGIISQAWYSGSSPKDKGTSIAVDAKVLSFAPINLPLINENYEIVPTFCFLPYLNNRSENTLCTNSNYLTDAPNPIDEWVGRTQILKEISYDWLNPEIKITGLIGFGGEGKSSLARRWIDELREDESQIQPDGIFWWNFDEKPNIDELFIELLSYLEAKDIANLPKYSADLYRGLIAKKLFECRYILVLDNLEIFQYQEGENIGNLKSTSLLKLLNILALNACKSFSLITSRVPLLDLIKYRSYKHREVGRLNSEDGISLLRKLNIKGSNKELGELVERWEGYALILSVLGSHLAQNQNVNIFNINEISKPISNVSRYDLVKRVLIEYDEHLTDEKRDFLMIFSLLRLPLKDYELDLFFTNVVEIYFNEHNKSLGKDEYYEMIRELVGTRITLYSYEKKYTMHPLLRNHYSSIFDNNEETKNMHKVLSNYYIKISEKISENPSLTDFRYPIESIHHLCCAEDFDGAWNLYTNLIQRGKNFLLTSKLGSYETALALYQEFFQDNDAHKNCYLMEPRRQAKLLNSVGYCFSSMGSLKEALFFYEKSCDIAKDGASYPSVSNIYQNLSRLYISLGDLKLAEKNATISLEIVKNNRIYRSKKEARLMPKLNALCSLAWIYSLEGKVKEANYNFQQASVLNSSIFGSGTYLNGFRGIYFADHLIRIRNFDSAKLTMLANKLDSEKSNSLPQLSRCYRVLGDLELYSGSIEKASYNYTLALDLARKICRQDILIEALIAYGKCKIAMGDLESALNNLLEALEYATVDSYQIYEVNIRIGLMELYLKRGHKAKAQFEAEYAKKLSENTGYTVRLS